MPSQLISIVTPVLNREKFIAEALESVRVQDYSPIEHIVIDGGSTDGTLKILGRCQGLKVHSAPDHGVYDALNRGIGLASGEIIGLLNSDDYYEPGTFATIAGILQRDPSMAAVSGGSRVFERSISGVETTRCVHPAVTQDSLLERSTLGAPTINSFFFRRSVFEEIGSFGTAYLVAADKDWLIRLWSANLKLESIDRVFYHYRFHEDSMTIHNDLIKRIPARLESLGIAESYLSRSGCPRALLRACRQWHSRDSIELVAAGIKSRRFDWIRIGVVSGWKTDARWPLALARRALSSLLG